MQTSSRSAVTKLKLILIICPIVIVGVLGGYYYYRVTLPPPPSPPPQSALPPPVTEDISERIDETGTILEDITVVSSDGVVTLIIPKGTKALYADGKPLKSMTIEPVEGQAFVAIPVGLAYNLQPEGATFDPSIKILMSYNETRVLQLGIPEGEMLMARYDTAASKWEIVYGALNTETNVMTSLLNHNPKSVLMCTYYGVYDYGM